MRIADTTSIEAVLVMVIRERTETRDDSDAWMIRQLLRTRPTLAIGMAKRVGII